MKKNVWLPILIGLLTITLSGCGQTGALYLPKKKAEKQVTTPATIDKTTEDTSK